MKLKINKKIVALLTTSSIALFSGCTSQNNNEDNKKELQSHKHFVVNFGNTPVIFKECEGYEICTSCGYGGISCNIIKDSKKIISSIYTTNGNVYYVNDEESVKDMEDKIIENGGYVYKLK